MHEIRGAQPVQSIQQDVTFVRSGQPSTADSFFINRLGGGSNVGYDQQQGQQQGQYGGLGRGGLVAALAGGGGLQGQGQWSALRRGQRMGRIGGVFARL